MWALRPSKASFIFCIRLLSLILAACLCCTACLGLFPDAPFLLLFWLRLEIIIVLFFNRITISRLLLFECFQDRFLEITYKRWYDRKRRKKNYFLYHFLNNNVFDAPVYEQPVYVMLGGLPIDRRNDMARSYIFEASSLRDKMNL